MKPNLHPKYKEITVNCSCGSTFTTRSTLEKDSLLLEVCAKCHPFYTGTQKMVDTAGRVDRFRQKYGLKTRDAAEAQPEAEAPAVKEAKPETEAQPKKEAKSEKKAKKDDKTNKDSK